jgi:hypothetical protein
MTSMLRLADGSALVNVKNGTTPNLNIEHADAVLSVIQTGGQVDGFTASNAVTINGELRLEFDGSPSGSLGTNPLTFDWAFRWLGSHEGDLEPLIGTKLTSNVVLGPGNVYYDGTYTYVGFEQQVAESVPEPSTFVLAGLGLAGLGLIAWRRRKKSISDC